LTMSFAVAGPGGADAGSRGLCMSPLSSPLALQQHRRLDQLGEGGGNDDDEFAMPSALPNGNMF
jgi:hypothetical protein